MKFFVTIFAIMILFQDYSYTQENISYQIPSNEILALADFQRPPSVMMNEKKDYIILIYRNTYKSLDDLNQEELRLGGLRINPVTNISSTINYINNLKIKKISENNEIQVVGLPENPKITYLSWAPDEKHLAFTNTTSSGVELWIVDVENANAKRLSEANLNANIGNPYTWYPNSQQILVRVIPSDKPKLIDQKQFIAKGPIVSTSDGGKAQNRTYQDLLKNPVDEINFANIIKSDLKRVDLSGNINSFLGNEMFAGESFSPDGKYLMITTIQKPFSYIVPFNRFPLKTQIYDLNGNLIKVVNDVPLTEVMPKGFMAVRVGKRSMSWRSDKPSTLFFVEALDEGNPEFKTPFRDELFEWTAPFDKAPVSLAKTINRFSDITWGNEEYAIVNDTWYDTRNTKTYLINPSSPKSKPKIIWDRNSQDIYSDPGNFETKKNQFNKFVLMINDDFAFLTGEGHTKDGQFPFVDELNLNSLKTKRIYQSSYKDKVENIYSIIDSKKGDILVRIESKSEFPNYYIRNIKSKSQPNQLTNFKNPFESIKDVHKEIIKYKRSDGVELSGTLYLPMGYDTTNKQKLPLLIWAYPEEFKDKNSAGQSDANPNGFTFPSYGSFIYWVTKGYVVLDNASFPIIGEDKEEPNDTFIKQLVDNAKSAIDALDARGYIDRKKVAIGGHSYGAFMTANLLTHSDLFACGIARSGAYNRTLTPFGFQSEQRNFWEAQNVYNEMSPFMNANKMKTPILLVHGEADNNPGTFTLQTERYFQALKGLGATARMVILPKESHGYVAKENIFHLLWEQDVFLEKYLKN